ncbi:hypothetical protein ACIA5D_36905 [Actinoplanes sp. NPDC051513]|uniref:hypothetical protein n=1 Tax=Actinoplanes sp. NPDC051513 TaxID=3363908 RepID=UPI0037A5C541
MRLDAWRRIRALRAEPIGNASDPSRVDDFRGALAQAEELADAADAAGYASNALPLFYAAEQCGRAVLEAHWRGNIADLSGHGLSYRLAQDTADPSKPDRNILRGRVIPARGKDGSFQAVCDAVGSPRLAGPVELGALWTANPDLREIKIPAQFGEWQPAISFGVGPRRAYDGMDGRPADPSKARTATGGFVALPIHMPGETVADVKQILGRYASLADAGVIVQGPTGGVLGADSALVERGYARDGRPILTAAKTAQFSLTFEEFWAAENALYSIVEIDHVRSEPFQAHWIGHALPDLCGQPAPHPLMLWWALLLGLSTLVRYHPGVWTGAINSDASVLADPFQRLIDAAAECVPVRLVEALTVK